MSRNLASTLRISCGADKLSLYGRRVAAKKFKSPPVTADIVSEVKQVLDKNFEQSGQTHRNFSDKEQSNTSDLRQILGRADLKKEK